MPQQFDIGQARRTDAAAPATAASGRNGPAIRRSGSGRRQQRRGPRAHAGTSASPTMPPPADTSRCAPRGPSPRPLARRHDEAAVVHRRAHRSAGPEAVFQARERRVGVHEHRVEVAVGEPARPVVVVLLVGARIDQDVAQAAHHLRRHARLAPRGTDHRQDLVGELLAAEREQLDQQHRRSCAVHRVVDQATTLGAGRGHVEHAVAADHGVAVVHAQRRQVDAFDLPCGTGTPGGSRPPLRNTTRKCARQRLGQREAARQVADAQRVLAVEEQRWVGRSHAWRRSTRAR